MEEEIKVATSEEENTEDIVNQEEVNESKEENESIVEESPAAEELAPNPPALDEDGNPIFDQQNNGGGFNIPLGGGADYSKVFDIQKEIFGNFDKDITDLKNAVNDINDINEDNEAKIKLICEYIDKNDNKVNGITNTFKNMFSISFVINIILLIWCICLTIIK